MPAVWTRSRRRQPVQRLDGLGELRLKEMDEAGIDLQVLSDHDAGAPEARC